MTHPNTPSPPDNAAPRQDALPWWKQNMSLLILTGLFAAMAMLVPVDIIDRVKALFEVEPVNISAPFQEETARLDQALDAGDWGAIDRAQLAPRRHDLMIRRILRAGPLNGEEVRRIKTILAEIDEQAGQETSAGAIEAWRRLRLERIAKAHPRLDAVRLEAALRTFETQYEKAMKE